MKVTQTAGHGAEVVLHGEHVRRRLSPRRASWRWRTATSSFTRSTIRRSSPGPGTVGLEMLEDAPDLDTIVVPIGGGGLMSGVSIAARALKPDIELIGVEAELYPSMKCAIDGATCRSAATRWPKVLRSSSRAS